MVEQGPAAVQGPAPVRPAEHLSDVLAALAAFGDLAMTVALVVVMILAVYRVPKLYVGLAALVTALLVAAVVLIGCLNR